VILTLDAEKALLLFFDLALNSWIDIQLYLSGPDIISDRIGNPVNQGLLDRRHLNKNITQGKDRDEKDSQ
jgi:hypothetical protein